jgi:hypothetical protein
VAVVVGECREERRTTEEVGGGETPRPDDDNSDDDDDDDDDGRGNGQRAQHDSRGSTRYLRRVMMSRWQRPR